MEFKFCQVCDSRYAILKISPKSGQPLDICLKCFKEKSQSGEFPSIDEIGIDRIKQVVDSFPSDSFEKNNKEIRSLSTTTRKKTKNTPTIDSMGKDITDSASKNILDPVIGRTSEIDRTVRILSRRLKNNPILIGEPGVGKTSVVEGLAQQIINGNVPSQLKNKRIVTLNMGSLVAGTKYRGEFEDRMKKIIEEATESDELVLFIDEIHTLVGAGGAEGAIDASNILKPALSRGEIQVIGATTLDEYRKYIEKDAALERRFQPVMVKEPTFDESVQILNGLKTKYEEFHKVEIEFEAIQSAVELATKYINDRFLPDKAIDLLDEACAKKKLLLTKKPNEISELEFQIQEAQKKKHQKALEIDFEATENAKKIQDKIKKELDLAISKYNKEKSRIITKEDIASIVAESTGIPVNQLTKEDIDKLKTLEDDLKKQVKGQNEAIITISKAIRRNKMGLKDPRRPIGVFLLLGPTGVGKTELARSISNLIYGSEDNMIRFDMSEFMESHSVSKLIGSPPGYVGYEDEGKLTKLLRQKPYSLVLFDEIEKAHSDVFNLLLQLFEEGRITDSKGRVINGKNTIFLMTSNAGSDVYKNNKGALGFGNINPQANLKDKVLSRLKDIFAPEFLNRLDDTLIFNQLQEDVMVEIAEKMLNELKSHLSTLDIEIRYTKTLVNHLTKTNFSIEYGARTLRREIDKIKDIIADHLIENENKKVLSLTVRQGQLHIN